MWKIQNWKISGLDQIISKRGKVAFKPRLTQTYKYLIIYKIFSIKAIHWEQTLYILGVINSY